MCTKTEKYYVYEWKFEKSNRLGIVPPDEYEHIESLSKDGNQLVLCGVGGNGKFAHFVKQHRVNNMLIEQDISSLMVVTDRDEDSDAKIGRIINKVNKAAVGTFFSIRNQQNAMRSFGTFISKIDWSKSESLKTLFLPFMYLGEEKPTENREN